MKKIIRLTEYDLTRIVKRVINEQSTTNKVGGEQLVTAYNKSPMCAKEWYNKNKNTSLVTNIESAIKTGDKENLGIIYNESEERKKTANDFINHQTNCSKKK
jgi:hypothetical protein